MSPTFGISQLTSFVYSATATDPNGDPLTFSWLLAATTRSGQSGTVTFVGGGTVVLAVTVTDGRGGTATDSRTITVGTLTGQWAGAGVSLGPFAMELTQSGPVVTGSYLDAVGPGGIPADLPGSIGGDGRVEIRIKQAPFNDWTFRGQMDPSGLRVTGTMHGSGFNGQAFTMDKR